MGLIWTCVAVTAMILLIIDVRFSIGVSHLSVDYMKPFMLTSIDTLDVVRSNTTANATLAAAPMDAVTAPSAPNLLVYSFFAIHTSYSGYASNPVEFFKPYLINRICYLRKHKIAFALQTVDWRKHLQFYKSVTYMKPALVKQIMRLNPQWLFFMDSDLVILDFERSLTEYLLEQSTVIVNDHNAALNNGAFFLRNTSDAHRFLQIWEDINNGKRAPFIHQDWPFTDNGAFIEALVQLGMQDTSASRCGVEFQRSRQGADFLRCYHTLFDELSGASFNGVSSRKLPVNVLLSQSMRGFNNHECQPHIISEWGWDERACFHQNETMILHSKIFKLAPVDSQACVSDEMFNSFQLEEEGTLLFLPGEDEPCRQDEDSCNQRATAFFKHEQG